MNKNILLSFIMAALHCFSVHAMEQKYYLITPKKSAEQEATTTQEKPIALAYIGDLKALENTTLADNTKFSIETRTFNKYGITHYISDYDDYASHFDRLLLNQGFFTSPPEHDNVRACIFEACPTTIEGLIPRETRLIETYGSGTTYSLYFSNMDIYSDVTEKTVNHPCCIRALLLPSQLNKLPYTMNLLAVFQKLLGMTQSTTTETQKNEKKTEEKPATIQQTSSNPTPQAKQTAGKPISIERLKQLDHRLFVMKICCGGIFVCLLGLIGYVFIKK